MFGGCKEQLENMGTWQGCIDGKGKDLCRDSCRVEMEECQESLVIKVNYIESVLSFSQFVYRWQL